MKRTIALLLTLTLLVGILTACGSKPKDSEPTNSTATDAPTEQAASDLDALRTELAEEFEDVFSSRLYEGAAYIVYRGDELYAGGTSKADKTSGADNGPDVVYHIASISKQFTAAAILKLCEQGKLSLDDTIEKYFPDYAIAKDVALHYLLTMQSGIPDYVRRYDEDGFEVDSAGAYVVGVEEDNPIEQNMEAIITHLYAQELLFTPGERYSYSNANYFLLGLIIEQVSGMSCHDYIRTNFFEPLGMNTAGFVDDYDNPDAVVAKGYHASNGSYMFHCIGVAFGCADIMASPKDLYKWTVALHGGEVLSDEMYQKMTTGYADIGNGSMYGYGLMIAPVSGMSMYFHPGSFPGFISFGGYIPEVDYFVSTMSNYACENAVTVAEKLTEITGKKIMAAEAEKE